LICDGAELPKVNYPELSTTLGSTYNVNGSTPISDAVNNFRIPDFRGHAPVGAGTPATGSPGAGVSYVAGTKTGERLHALTVGEVPRHTHDPGTLAADGNTANITGNATNGNVANITGNATNGGSANITVNNDGTHSHSLVGLTPDTFFGWDSSNTAFNRADLFRLIDTDTGAASAGAAHTHPIGFSSPADLAGRILGINAVFFNEIYMNQTIPGNGSAHSHGLSQSNHTHTISQTNHTHTINQTNHTHTVSGATENGTAAGLGAGSPTHNNVGPVLPTNFIIKF
jgi:microcystin-dependent protein